MNTKENMKLLPNGSFLVRTQAGFNKAIKLWVGDDVFIYKDDYDFKFPKVYPSVVSFYSYYRGADYYNCTCTPLNKYTENLKALLLEER